jgi:hypothetical protein
MATATKRAMVTDGNNTGNGYGEEPSGQATAATMAMGMGREIHGCSHYNWKKGDDGGNGPWFV